MALMDRIKGLLGGKGSNSDLLGQLSGMLTGKSGDGLGLSRLVDQFKSAGLGEKAVGADRVNEMAKKSGLSVDAVNQELAHLIPNLVNKLTPDGKLPNPWELVGMVKSVDLGKLLGR
jgi:uncharacterized protein YidB (DUF937 family)